MSDHTTTHVNTTGNTGSTGVALIVGGLVVAVGILAYIFMADGSSEQADVSVTVEGAGAAAEDAAAAVEGAAEGAASAVEGAASAVEDAATGN